MEIQLERPEIPEKGEESPMENPFTFAPDIDIFSIRNKERKQAKAERERMKAMKIHEKMTYSTKIKAKQKDGRKALQMEEDEEDRKLETNEERLRTLQESLLWKTAMKRDYSVKKEALCDYVNGRREIFLLEYAMAVKRDEIQRMEDIIKDEERKLQKAEYYLEEDATTFDEFLKEKHKNSVQALKISEKETTAKAKKIKEIQAITSQIENLKSDIYRFKNTVRDYKTYRDFLYQLCPKEWQEEHGKKHTKEKDLETASKDQGRKTRTNSSSPNSMSDTDAPGPLLSSRSLRLGSLQDIRPQLKKLLKPLTGKLGSLEDAESETCLDEDEKPDLYFTDPQQLLSIFMEMEEENLSFIQNSQETEESLQKVQHSFVTTHESTEKKLAELKQQVATLKSSIAKEEERVADLKLKADDQAHPEIKDEMLTSLHKKVLEVYCHCTGENETDLEPVEMLMVIEKQLFDLLDHLETIPPENIEQAKKAKEKERRLRLRTRKLRQQKQQQEERLQRALERSQATVKIKSGRRLVFRSNPPARREKKKHSQEEMDKEKEEELYYFT
ncbi:cilia- and flagella-associated protein 100 [Caloenas nicobarica]|uniref:cilia- and flagella-associated protein 100 n=1 Tax=Caloenas nicobarica TaxID=187106 RepID=UPI0032B72976